MDQAVRSHHRHISDRTVSTVRSCVVYYGCWSLRRHARLKQLRHSKLGTWHSPCRCCDLHECLVHHSTTTTLFFTARFIATLFIASLFIATAVALASAGTARVMSLCVLVIDSYRSNDLTRIVLRTGLFEYSAAQQSPYHSQHIVVSRACVEMQGAQHVWFLFHQNCCKLNHVYC